MTTTIIPPIVNDNYRYNVGLLTQWCSGCAWKAEDLRKEVTVCPECGAPVAKDCLIEFGGTTVRFRSRKNRFYLSSRCSGGYITEDGKVEIEETTVFETDFPDTLVFMIRHGNFWRRDGC